MSDRELEMQGESVEWGKLGVVSLEVILKAVGFDEIPEG